MNFSDFMSPPDARTGGAFASGVHPGRADNYNRSMPQGMPKMPLADFMKLALGFMGRPMGKMMSGAFQKPMASQASPKPLAGAQRFAPKNYGVGPLGVALNTPRYQKAKASYQALANPTACQGGT